MALDALKDSHLGEPLEKRVHRPLTLPLCGIEEESMNHLLNICNWTKSLWNWMETIFKSTDRNKDSIQESIAN